MPNPSISKTIAPFGVVGLSHKTAPLELRSAFSLTKEQLPEFLQRARKAGFSECVVLATCNRTELYFAGADGMAAAELLADHAGIPLDLLKGHLYERSCICAACHVIRVAAGLDSAVLGETEIVAQVKEAWAIANEQGMVGPMLDLLFKRAREASKRIRTETKLNKSVVSTAALALRESRSLVGPLEGKTLLLLGAGKMAIRLGKELADLGGSRKIVANRSLENAKALADKMGAEARGFDSLRSSLEDADVVFAAVGAGRAVIDTQMLREVMATRPDRPLLVLDLGVPPNVEPGVKPDDVHVVGLDELSSKAAANTQVRNASIDPSLRILDEEIGAFCEGLIKHAASPTIRALLEFGETVRKRNVDWARERLPDLEERDLKVIDELSRRMIIGLLESPIHTLKTDIEWSERRHLVEHLFALDGGI